ncbi:Predicted flavoprotein [Achromobacter denitrificans]|nr:Predicted flavoprotein [Achromobacter denitrificans]
MTTYSSPSNPSSAEWDLPSLDDALLDVPSHEKLALESGATHPPRILLLYGSLRERSYSRLLTEEAARILTRLGAETRIFDPRGLPLPDGAPADHPKVAELRALSLWSEGQVWCSPERHGTLTGVFKSQIDWLPWKAAACAPRKAARWPSCRYRAGRNPLTRLTPCACWADGCGW